MNGLRLSVFSGLLVAWAGTCGAAEQVGHGIIQFRGGIVEPVCTTSSGTGSVMELKGCPLASRGNLIDVRSVRPASSVKALGQSEAKVKLVADSGMSGRYYNQSYILIDNAGVLIRSGSYVVTLRSP